MKFWRMAVIAAIAVAFVVACMRSEELENAAASSEALSYNSGASELWGPDSGPIAIPYCFVTTPPASTCLAGIGAATPATITNAEVAVYTNAIEHTWGNASRIKPIYNGICNTATDSSQKIVIWIYGVDESDLLYRNGGQTGVCADPDAGCTTSYGLGDGTLVTVNTVTCPEFASVRIFSNGHMTYSRDRMNYVAVHEFGHVLGWGHEQDQEGGLLDPNFDYNPAVCAPAGSGSDAGNYVPNPSAWNDVLLTGYDPDSVMNYCRTAFRGDDGRLSDLDIAGIQGAYGAVDQTKDSDGDGYADYRDNCPYVVNASQDDAKGSSANS